MFTIRSKIPELQFRTLTSCTFLNREQKKKILLFRFFTLFVLIIWIIGFLPPIIFNIQNPFINFILKKIFSTVCHQQNYKCISIDGLSMLVCARCTGIYTGIFIAVFTTLFIIIPEMSIKFLIVSAVPLLIDVILTTLGVYVYSQLLAFLTGLTFGAAVYLFTRNELENFLLNRN